MSNGGSNPGGAHGIDPIEEEMREPWETLIGAVKGEEVDADKLKSATDAFDAWNRTHCTPEQIEDLQQLREQSRAALELAARMPDDSSFFYHGCPRCRLRGAANDMLLNTDDFWECPQCHLQALVPGWGMFAILHFPGRGDFKDRDTKALDYAKGSVLTRAGETDVFKVSTEGFRDMEDLRAFLGSIPEPQGDDT